jgi:alpha-L-fucosidase
LKLRVAAYYYNRAHTWGKEVSLSAKKAAFAPGNRNTQTIGAIMDFEKIGARSPAGIRPGAWQVDEPIGSTWGYTSDMRVAGPGSIIAKLVDTVSKNGTLLLNLSPKADGTIPVEQQNTLRAVGRWLELNGEAIYDTHNWIQFRDGDEHGRGGPNIRFTVKGDVLYAIVLGQWPGAEVVIQALASGRAPAGKIASVTLLGSTGELAFTQAADGLKVTLPARPPGEYAWTLKIRGMEMNPPTWTASGNPP